MGCTHCERQNERIDLLTEKITSYEQLVNEIKKGHKLFVLEDTVIDVNRFLSLHPGGAEMLLSCVGTEISRFFYGGFKFKNMRAHTHSEGAAQMLANISIGVIKSSLRSRIFRAIRFQNEEQLDKESWKVVSKKMISSKHAVFQFRSPNFKVAAMLPYFDHCGKYYTLYSSHLKMARNFATIFSPSESILSYYLEFLEAFKNETAYITSFPDINNIQKDYLELFVKKIGTFSTFLHDFPFGEEDVKGINNDFKVRGPYGPGLMLEPDQKGVIVGVTCGTGVVLFLDLAMYLLRMLIYKIGRTKKKTYMMFGKESFDRLNDKSFKLILFSSFSEKSEVLAEPLFRALHDISSKYMFNIFEYYLRISEKGDPRWSEDTFKKCIPLSAKKVFVLGPHGAEESLREILKHIGIKDHQLYSI